MDSGAPRAGQGILQVAQTCVGTRALGPGVRSVVWVQGCPFRCRGCIAPDWIPFRAARAMSPEELADELLSDPAVTGFTFSGGEPMSQAAGLTAVILAARRRRALSLICFTGYRLRRLRVNPPNPGVDALLAQTDVLIDGQYVAEWNTGRGLRGSANQNIHFLTGSLVAHAAELADGPRRAEIRFAAESALLIGVPPPGLAAAFDAGLPKPPARARAREIRL
jgi:anaerobic ribonucleoside-triphosphate reductase activating protein